MRCVPETSRGNNINWHIVDYELRQALEKYNQIRKCGGQREPIYLDLIIKITVSVFLICNPFDVQICRAYANLMNRKILTAEKILDYARKLINFLHKGKIKIDMEWREEVPFINLDILK